MKSKYGTLVDWYSSERKKKPKYSEKDLPTAASSTVHLVACNRTQASAVKGWWLVANRLSHGMAWQLFHVQQAHIIFKKFKKWHNFLHFCVIGCGIAHVRNQSM